MKKYVKSTASLHSEKTLAKARDYYIRFIQSKFVTQKDDFDKYGNVYRALPKAVKELLKFRAKQGLVEIDIPKFWNDDSVEGEVD